VLEIFLATRNKHHKLQRQSNLAARTSNVYLCIIAARMVWWSEVCEAKAAATPLGLYPRSRSSRKHAVTTTPIREKPFIA
jgi:hypothetical protein